MRVLGVSYNYHDASAALGVDGRPVAAAAEERFSRQKHDPTYPHHAIQHCLRAAGVRARDLDFVAFHEDPASKMSRSLAAAFTQFPRSLGTFLKSAQESMTSGFWIRRDLSQKLDIPLRKILFVPHHMSHAAHAFLTSPFEESTVMTLDAVGEWTSSAIFRARRENGRATIEPLDVSPFPHSLGLAYSAFTAFLGFKVNDGECSTMALAAFGRPTYVDAIRQAIRVLPDGSHELDLAWFDFRHDDDIPVTDRFRSVFGEPRPFKSKLPFRSFESPASKLIAPTAPTLDDQRYADIAASLQLVLEDAVCAWARRAAQLGGKSEHLCYAGGIALNCVANSRLASERIFGKLYIPPDPGDGGGAMGAALYAHATRAETPEPKRVTPFLGEAIDDSELAELLPHLDPSGWHRFSRIKLAPLGKEDLLSRRFGNDPELIAWTAQKLRDGKIIGWCQGAFENGPRALGNRSILIRPDDLSLAERLSREVKLRASFRPYALSMTLAEARASLELKLDGSDADELPSHWMQSSYKVKASALGNLRAATHIDQTTRAQCVDPAENPLFHELLRAYGELSGHEALLNTSFNESGYPLVGSVTDALLVFARTELDVLVVGRHAIEKNREARRS